MTTTEQQFRQLQLPVSWHLSYRADEYVVSECNRYAFDWLEKWPFQIQENFACIVGEKGSGKSHLAEIWAQRVNAEVISVHNGFFDKWFDISSNINNKKYFVLDDADTIDDDILLFYVYNTIKEHNIYLLLTAKTPPIQWDIKLADVRSRLLTINVVDIHKPDEEVVFGIIKQMLKQRGFETLPETIINYIGNNVERSYESINYWINKIDSSLPQKSKLTLSFVKTILS